MNKKRFTLFILSIIFLLQGCNTLPIENESRNLAIGQVTISTPIFSPITGSVSKEKQLSFGELKEEKNIAESLNVPVLGITRLEYDAIRAALASKYSGSQLTQNSSNSLKEQSDTEQIISEREEENSRTFKSPEIPTSTPPLPKLPPDVEKEFINLLKRSNTTFQFDPIELANRVAFAKKLMVDLEEYLNLESYTTIFKKNRWKPYKVHFTVTADPGWYTRLNKYDAVVDIALKLPSSIASIQDHEHAFKIVTVSPSETAQTIEELQSSFRTLASALDLEGAFQTAAVKLALDRVTAIGKRLEGIKKHTTVVVSYLKSNQIRIRFRPELVPFNEERDLQPTSKFFTATVIVRENLAKYITSDFSNLDTETDKGPRVFIKDFELESEKRTLVYSKEDAENNKDAIDALCNIEVSSSFTPALTSSEGWALGYWLTFGLMFEEGRYDPPPLYQREKLAQRIQTEENKFIEKKINITAPIPVWPAPLDIFEVQKGFGYYWSVSEKASEEKYKAAISFILNNPKVKSSTRARNVYPEVRIEVYGTKDVIEKIEGATLIEERLYSEGKQAYTAIINIPKPKIGAHSRVFLQISQLNPDTTNGTLKTRSLEIVLEEQSKLPLSSSSFTIDGDQIKLTPTPIEMLDKKEYLNFLKSIIERKKPEKPAKPK